MMEETKAMARPLRVLITFPAAPAAGGAQYTAITAANLLVRKGHQVVFASGPGEALKLLDKRVEYRHLPWSYSFFALRLYPFWPPSMFGFLRIALTTKVDLVHGYCDSSFMLGAMARVLTGTPCLYTELGPALPPAEVCHLAGNVIVCSEELKDKISVAYGLPKQNLIVIPNHLDLERYRPGLDWSGVAARLGLESAAKRIVILTRIIRTKYGTLASVLRVIPEVLKTIPQLEVIVVGNGEEFHAAERDVQAVNDQEGRRVVRLVGAVFDVPEVLNAAHIVVGIGRSAMEGMACRRPTLIVGQKGYAGTVCPEKVRELAHYNFAGRNLAEPSSPHLLVEALVRILTDAAYAEAVGRFGRDYAEQHLNPEKDAVELERIYYRAANRARDRRRDRLCLAGQLAKLLLQRLWIVPRLSRKLRRILAGSAGRSVAHAW